MLDPAGEKCDLHIRAAGIFVMQLELLEIQRLVALSHNEGAILDDESIFATGQCWEGPLLSWMLFSFAIVPQPKLSTRAHTARPAG